MMLSWRLTNFWVAGQLLCIIFHLIHLSCLVRANGLNYHGQQQAPPMLPGYNSPNMNPFLPLYSNAAPFVPSYSGQYYGNNNGNGDDNGNNGYYTVPRQQQIPRPVQYPSRPSYVPIQQAFTVAYYPNYAPISPRTPTGPHVPAPPGQKPYCAKNGETFCEQVEYYPTKLVLRLLENTNVDDLLISEDEVDLRSQGYYNITPTYFYDYSYTTNSNGQAAYPQGYYPHHRNKRQVEEDDMCPTDEDYVTAKVAENRDGDWRYVVNLPEVDKKFTQVVKVSKCRSSQCRGLCTPPTGVKTHCEQQYVHTRLFALDPNGGKFNNEIFKFPHCCICKFK